MQIGAIRPMNFKCMNTVSFKGEEVSTQPEADQDTADRFEQAGGILHKMAGEDKGPIGRLLTVFGFGATSAGKAAGTYAGVDNLLFKGGFSENVEKVLKWGSGELKIAAGRLKGIENEKYSNIAEKAGNILEGTEKFAKKCYKKLGATSSKRVAVLAGIIGALMLVPKLMKKDNNEDGIEDYKQTCQSAYDTQAKKFDKMGKFAREMAELKGLLS